MADRYVPEYMFKVAFRSNVLSVMVFACFFHWRLIILNETLARAWEFSNFCYSRVRVNVCTSELKFCEVKIRTPPTPKKKPS